MPDTMMCKRQVVGLLVIIAVFQLQLYLIDLKLKQLIQINTPVTREQSVEAQTLLDKEEMNHTVTVTPSDSFNGKAHDDPALVAYLKEHVILPPSALPYNLTVPSRKHYSQFGQSSIVDGILKNMTDGFFIEVGANGGEYLSNSLFFERERGWTGLLIEPDTRAFARLVSKHRKAYLVNACLSTNPTPMTVKFKPMGNLSFLSKISEKDDKRAYPVQCFPLHSILLALGVSRIDYFSLDIEGVELAVLQTIPWDKIEVRVLDIEVNHIPEGKQAVRKYMESVGYTFVKEDHIDFFFIKKSLFTEEELNYIINNKLT